MARNRITFEIDFDQSNRAIYRFTGSQRQPTLDEVENYIIDNRLQWKIPDSFMICAVRGNSAEGEEQHYFDEYDEKNKVLELWGYDCDSYSCPICGHEREMSGKKCPVCMRPWEE